MTKLLGDVNLETAVVKAFDKNHKLLYTGDDVVEWIDDILECIDESAIYPGHVEVEGVEGRFSVDKFLEEFDKQEENSPYSGILHYFREKTKR